MTFPRKELPFLSISLMFLCTAILNAQDARLPFDINEVIEQAKYQSNFGSPRESEFLLDTSVFYVDDPEDQGSPAACSDGTNFLVVFVTDAGGGIAGTRVDQSANVLDPAGITIAQATGYRDDPSVAFDGNNFLVVWFDTRNAPDYAIYGTRIDQSGNILDPDGILISGGTHYEGDPSIAFNGTNYLVAWTHNGCDIYGTRIDQNGNVLDPSGIAISTVPGYQTTTSVASDGTDFLVVWQDERNVYQDIYGARVDQAGNVLDPNGIGIAVNMSNQQWPSVAFNGTYYLTAWCDNRSGSTNDIYGARIDPAGNVLDPGGINISTAPDHQDRPAVTSDFANFFVVWRDDRGGNANDVYGTRVNQEGIVLEPSGIFITECSSRHNAVAFCSVNYLTVWQDNRPLSMDVRGARVDLSGTVLDTNAITISTAANIQKQPSVAFDGTNYLAVWADKRSNSDDYHLFDIYCTRVDQSGNLLDTTSFPISTINYDQVYPAVAFGDSNYLAVWEHWYGAVSSKIYGARVDRNGIVIDTSGIAISTAGGILRGPAVAFDGTNFFAVWKHANYDIYGTRIDQNGNVLDPLGVVISLIAGDQECPAVSFDGTNYLTVWKNVQFDSADIYGARVDPSGYVLDPNAIAISTAPDSQTHPDIAFDGTNYLVVWQDQRNGSDADIYGTRMDQSGSILDPAGITVCNAQYDQTNPAVIFDGADYMVVWEHHSDDVHTDIRGARVSTSGAVLNTFLVSDQPGNQLTPCLAHGTADSLLIAYSGYVDSMNVHPMKTMRIWGKYFPLLGFETRDTSLTYDAIDHFQIHPNPFSILATININYANQSTGMAVKIYDIAGRITKEFSLPAASCPRNRDVLWDGRNDSGKMLPSGVYFVELKSGDYTETKKLVLIKQ